jgi:hypothetical protein
VDVRTIAGAVATVVSAAATTATVYIRNRSRERRLAIEKASPKDRARIVSEVVPMFDIKAGGLTQDQQFQVAIQQLSSRDRQMSLRFRLAAFATTVFAAATVTLAYSQTRRVTQTLQGENSSGVVIEGNGNQVSLSPKP